MGEGGFAFVRRRRARGDQLPPGFLTAWQVLAVGTEQPATSPSPVGPLRATSEQLMLGDGSPQMLRLRVEAGLTDADRMAKELGYYGKIKNS